jgi:hypothetical protein
MTKMTIAVVLAWGLAVAVTARAQTAPEAPPQAAALPDAAAAAVVPAIPPMVAATIPIGTRVGMGPSNYEDGNRRDPFSSLIAPRSNAPTAAPSTRRINGLPGLALADVTVRGVVKHGPTTLAILEGPSGQSFVARLKDQLRDASVESIDQAGVVFAEQVGAGQRISVRKTIRPAGEDFQ